MYIITSHDNLYKNNLFVHIEHPVGVRSNNKSIKNIVAEAETESNQPAPQGELKKQNFE